MDDQQVKAGLTDAELAVHPTVFAADALKDRVVVVSGGAGGIGRAIAWLFARLGAHVAVVGRNQNKLDGLVADLTSRHLKASAYVADIREPDAVNALSGLQSGGLTDTQSLGMLERLITQQAFTLSADELYFGSAILFLGLTVIVWFARPVKAGKMVGGGDH